MSGRSPALDDRAPRRRLRGLLPPDAAGGRQGGLSPLSGPVERPRTRRLLRHPSRSRHGPPAFRRHARRAARRAGRGRIMGKIPTSAHVANRWMSISVGTSGTCPDCGTIGVGTLSRRTHVCGCVGDATTPPHGSCRTGPSWLKEARPRRLRRGCAGTYRFGEDFWVRHAPAFLRMPVWSRREIGSGRYGRFLPPEGWAIGLPEPRAQEGRGILQIRVVFINAGMTGSADLPRLTGKHRNPGLWSGERIYEFRVALRSFRCLSRILR